jgi:hypothetical protein
MKASTVIFKSIMFLLLVTIDLTFCYLLEPIVKNETEITRMTFFTLIGVIIFMPLMKQIYDNHTRKK